MQKLENLGIFRLLRHSARNLSRGIDLRQGVGHPCLSEAKVPKWHPSGTSNCSKATPQRSSATSKRSYCSQRAKFFIFVLKVKFLYTDNIGTLIND